MSEKWDALERGRQMFRDGVFRPVNRWSDEEWADICDAGQCEWLGWMMERADKLTREWKAQALVEAWDRWANGDGPMPDAVVE